MPSFLFYHNYCAHIPKLQPPDSTGIIRKVQTVFFCKCPFWHSKYQFAVWFTRPWSHNILSSVWVIGDINIFLRLFQIDHANYLYDDCKCSSFYVDPIIWIPDIWEKKHTIYSLLVYNALIHVFILLFRVNNLQFLFKIIYIC